MHSQETTADRSRDDSLASPDEILQQTNKRLTLNLLIQGAGMHSFLTAHHLVRDELESIRPGLVRCYDTMAVSLALNYFIGDSALNFALPSWFWSRTHRPSHPFFRHRLLAKHGRELWLASKRYLLARGWKKRVIGIPVLHCVQLFWMFARTAWVERGRRAQLARVAESACAMQWGIDPDRLEARLTTFVTFGHLQAPKTMLGKTMRIGAIGYGGVERRNGQFTVVARAWIWPLVAHELTKGTMELVCLHGLNTLDKKTYHAVIDVADQLEYEPWMLQAGSELWRRLLAAMPRDRRLPETLMHIARLDPDELERLMLAVVEDRTRAQALLQALG